MIEKNGRWHLTATYVLYKPTVRRRRSGFPLCVRIEDERELYPDAKLTPWEHSMLIKWLQEGARVAMREPNNRVTFEAWYFETYGKPYIWKVKEVVDVESD